MPDLADLTQTYAPRLAEFVSDERFGPWRLKLYGLADPARACARSCSTRPASAPPPASRTTATAPPSRSPTTRAYPIALVYWWQATTSCTSARSSAPAIAGLEPVQWTPAGCV